MAMDEEKEKEFDDWLESIVFVNPGGELVPLELTEDKSSDPQGDRG